LNSGHPGNLLEAEFEVGGGARKTVKKKNCSFIEVRNSGSHGDEYKDDWLSGMLRGAVS
jgi:hypothetical protein